MTVKIIHSGGAIGADYTWGKFGKEHGYEVRHYYYKNKTPLIKKVIVFNIK